MQSSSKCCGTYAERGLQPSRSACVASWKRLIGYGVMQDAGLAGLRFQYLLEYQDAFIIKEIALPAYMI